MLSSRAVKHLAIAQVCNAKNCFVLLTCKAAARAEADCFVDMEARGIKAQQFSYVVWACFN